MQSKRRSLGNKSQPKSQSTPKNKDKKSSSPANREKSKRKQTTQIINNIPRLLKKPVQQKLVKRKIQDLKPPQILIKVNYKGKRISIPIHKCDNKGLNDAVLPHIIRFQHQVLNNRDFVPGTICNWKTSGRVDILKDYYFQTNRPISVFKEQLLEIQPIWREKRPNPAKLSDFEILKCVGTGGFSRVFLTRLKATGVFYALKLMEKEGLIETGKQCVVINQRNIMSVLKSPHITNLQFAFETKHFVALAMEYCPGGQLFFYLRRVRRMTQEQARYCFVEVLLGLQYLHGQNVVYRDIKPENIMIDLNGSLKIADFGLSRQGLRPNQLATTFCGSPEYMAPQMLARNGHSYAVDYYCVGALLYELVTGNPPFYSRDVQQIYNAITNQEISFPPNVELSSQIKMLIQGLLVKDPRKRLGSMGGIREILGHPWVRKLKPADIINKTVQSPIKFQILNFNINQEQIEKEGEKIFMSKLKDQDQDFQFFFTDFYFNRYDESNILDEALPSVKSQSTKQNKSPKVHQSKEKKMINPSTSALSREHNHHFQIDIQHPNPPISELQRAKISKKLKKVKSKQKLELVQRAKKRQTEKSMSKILQRQKSPNPSAVRKIGLGNTLKTMKSSGNFLNHKKNK